MKENIIFRKVKHSDAEEFVLLENFIYKQTYKDVLPEEVIKNREEKTWDKIQSFDNDHCNNDEKICYVAEVDGRIVGYMWGNINSTYEFFNEKGYADLVALYIHPDYQRMGIGSKLKTIFKDWAKQNGASKYVIGVLKENKKARSAYEKWGGKLESYTSKYKGCDEVFYTYEL